MQQYINNFFLCENFGVLRVLRMDQNHVPTMVQVPGTRSQVLCSVVPKVLIVLLIKELELTVSY